MLNICVVHHWIDIGRGHGHGHDRHHFLTPSIPGWLHVPSKYLLYNNILVSCSLAVDTISWSHLLFGHRCVFISYSRHQLVAPASRTPAPAGSTSISNKQQKKPIHEYASLPWIVFYYNIHSQLSTRVRATSSRAMGSTLLERFVGKSMVCQIELRFTYWRWNSQHDASLWCGRVLCYAAEQDMLIIWLCKNHSLILNQQQW